MLDPNANETELDQNGSLLSAEDNSTNDDLETQDEQSEVGGESNEAEEEELTLEQAKERLKALAEDKEKLAKEKEKLEHGYQKTIAKQTAKAKSLEAQLKQLQFQAQATEPQRDSFATDEAYIDAVVEHRSKLQQTTQAVQAEIQQAQEELVKPFYERAKVLGITPDQIAQSAQVITQAVQQSGLAWDADLAQRLVESELGAKITLHLAKHPQDALVLARALPSEREALFARLEHGLSQAPKTTQAPPPIKRGSANVNTDTTPSDAMSYWRKTKGLK